MASPADLHLPTGSLIEIHEMLPGNISPEPFRHFSGGCQELIPCHPQKAPIRSLSERSLKRRKSRRLFSFEKAPRSEIDQREGTIFCQFPPQTPVPYQLVMARPPGPVS